MKWKQTFRKCKSVTTNWENPSSFVIKEWIRNLSYIPISTAKFAGTQFTN